MVLCMNDDLHLALKPDHLIGMDLNVYWLDNNGFYLGCNKKVLDFFHISEQMVVSKNNSDLVQAGILNQSLATHIDKSNQYVLTKKQPLLNVVDPIVKQYNGKPAQYISHRFPLFDKKKNIVGILGFSMDITDKILITQSGLFGYAIMAAHSDQQHKYVNEFFTGQAYCKKTMDISIQEARCLYYLLKGKSARETGEILFRSTRTIEGHITSVKQKLNCTTRSELFDRLLNDIELLCFVRFRGYD